MAFGNSKKARRRRLVQRQNPKSAGHSESCFQYNFVHLKDDEKPGRFFHETQDQTIR